MLAVMAVNYGLRGVAHHRALTLAPRLFGPTLPQRCDPRPSMAVVDSWPRSVTVGPADRSGKRCLVEIAAIPTFLSPFRWRVVAHLSNAYEIHDIDVLDPRFRAPARESEVLWRTTVRFPNVWTPEVERAARTNTAQIFLGVSRFPAVRSLVDRDSAATVRWIDLRFVGGLIALEQPVRAPGPFAVTVRVGADGQILEEHIDQ